MGLVLFRAFGVLLLSISFIHCSTDLSRSTGALENGEVPKLEVILETTPELISTTRSASFSFRSVDAQGNSVPSVCRLDSGDFSACTSPKTFNNLPSGQHRFEVKAVVDGVESAPAEFAWFIDLVDITPPTFRLAEAPFPSLGSTRAHLRLEYSDNMPGDITVRCRLDNGPETNCQRQVTYYDLNDGQTYIWRYRLVDAAGNSTGNQTHEWTVNLATGMRPAPSVASPLMSYFVSSRGGPNGGDLGGLAGADQHCQNLASNAGVGGKTWRAYLSADAFLGNLAVHARDRIGSGPWFNYHGNVIANTIEELHQNGVDPRLAFDEEGANVGSQRVEHDILTGSSSDGRLRPGSTCDAWTSNSNLKVNHVGHVDWALNPPYVSAVQTWNSSHNSRCDAAGIEFNLGAAKVYCFAID